MSIKTLFICKICNKYFDEPVNLACYCVVCKRHVSSLPEDPTTHKITCLVCHETFDPPTSGDYKINQAIKQVMDRDEHLTNERERHLKQSLKASALTIERLGDALKPAENGETLCEQHFATFKQKIDARRLDLIKQVDFIANSFIAEYSSGASAKKELEEALTETRRQNERLLASFSQPDLDLGEVEEQKTKQDSKIQTLQAKVQIFEGLSGWFEKGIEFTASTGAMERTLFGEITQLTSSATIEDKNESDDERVDDFSCSADSTLSPVVGHESVNAHI